MTSLPPVKRNDRAHLREITHITYNAQLLPRPGVPVKMREGDSHHRGFWAFLLVEWWKGMVTAVILVAARDGPP